MSQIEDAIRDHEERCGNDLPKKHPTWIWVVGIAMTLLSVTAGASFKIGASCAAVSTKSEQLDDKNREQDRRLDNIEKTIGPKVDRIDDNVVELRKLMERGRR